MDIIVGLIVWIIVGLVAGTLAGAVVKRRKAGLGRWGNIGVGMVGAVIGGFLFSLLNIDIGFGVSISLNDLLAAFIGAVIFLLVLSFFTRDRSSAGEQS